MENTESIENRNGSEAEVRPDAFWRKVYFAVIVNAFVVVTALWLFSRYFSG